MTGVITIRSIGVTSPARSLPTAAASAAAVSKPHTPNLAQCRRHALAYQQLSLLHTISATVLHCYMCTLYLLSSWQNWLLLFLLLLLLPAPVHPQLSTSSRQQHAA
jgi:hypothetical protein